MNEPYMSLLIIFGVSFYFIMMGISYAYFNPLDGENHIIRHIFWFINIPYVMIEYYFDNKREEDGNCKRM